MKSKLICFVIMGMLLSLPLFSLEIKVMGNQEHESRVLNQDYLYSGNTLNFQGQAEDIYFVGKELNMKGESTGGVTAFGEIVTFNGKVANDVISAARNITVNGKIDGSIFLAGGEIRFNEESVAEGSLFIATGNVKIYGTVNGDIYAGCGVFMIDGTVNGDIHVGAGEIILTEKAKINGDFNYYADNQITENEKSRISGKIFYENKAPFNLDSEFNSDDFKWIGWIAKIIWLLSFVVMGLLIQLIPANRKFNYVKSNKHFWNYLLWGLLPFFIFPVAIVVSFVLVITIPMAILLLLAAFPLVIVTIILGVSITGEYLFRLFGWQSQNRFLYFLFGTLFYTVFSFIPFLGAISLIFFSSLGWGILLEKLFKRKLVNASSLNREDESDIDDSEDL